MMNQLQSYFNFVARIENYATFRKLTKTNLLSICSNQFLFRHSSYTTRNAENITFFKIKFFKNCFFFSQPLSHQLLISYFAVACTMYKCNLLSLLFVLFVVNMYQRTQLRSNVTVQIPYFLMELCKYGQEYIYIYIYIYIM